ncbi:MAG: SdrD B-like domain-containing protein, partial [Candidatus Peribacteraceae bacterium]|nr:SdrD B-like domain-containing protein [Candidatus Peribacteraceae bacterium]
GTIEVYDPLWDVQIGGVENTGLIGHWTFDEGKGVTAHDYSGQGNDGTLTNMDATDWVKDTGLPGNQFSLDFDGTDDYIDVGNSGNWNFGTTSAFTFSLWVQFDANIGTNGILLSSYDGTDGWQWYKSTSTLISIYPSATLTIPAEDELVVDQWYHFTMTRPASNTAPTFYLDGISLGQFTSTLDANNDGNILAIGSNAPGTPPITHEGSIDDVRIYNRALSAKEVGNLAAGKYADGDNSTATITLGASLEVKNDFYIQSGILSAGSNAITISGSWLGYSGVNNFTAGTSTVTFDGSASQAAQKQITGSGSFNNVTFDNGLVGYWKFDEGGGTVARDSSANGNDGTLTNMDGDDWVDVKAGTGTTNFYNAYALDFDGTNDFVDAGNQSVYEIQTFAISTWFKTSTSGFRYFASEYESDANSWYIRINSNNTATFHAAGKKATSSATVNDGVWHHAVGVKDAVNDYTKLYLDGSEVGTNTESPLTFDSTTFKIGILTTGPLGPFDGLIDDVRMYNRALSASEVANLNSGNPSTGSGYYTFGGMIDIAGDLKNYTGNLVSSGSITMSGNWLNVGDFTHDGGGTVNFDGSDQTISGSTVFWNLTSTGASADTLTFDYTSRQSVSGALTLKGASANLLTLTTTKSGSASKLILDASAGTQDLQLLDVTDNDATGGALLTPSGSTDSENNTNWLFGYFTGTGDILGNVWYDKDYDGVKDAGETSGLTSVTLDLSGNTITGATLSMSTTSASSSGSYTLSPIYRSDTSGYTVAISGSTISDGYRNTNFTSSGGNIVETGSTITINYGYSWYGTMSGLVLWDEDGDGTQDAGDTNAISGATVTLTGSTVTGASLSLTATSTSTGAFNFYEVPASNGNYTISVTKGASHSVTLSNQNQNAMGTGTHMPSSTFLMKYRTGTGAINGKVWTDSDGDGVHDAGESDAFSGVTLSLSGTTTTGATLALTTQTDLAGTFAFSGAALSDLSGHSILLTDSAGIIPSDYISTTYSISGSIVVGTGAAITLEFGYIDESTVTGRAYEDADNDSTYDVGESYFPGREISVIGTSATGGAVSASGTTNSEGIYSISGLNISSGSYVIAIDPPSGYTARDANSASFTVTTAGSSTTQDFRYSRTSAASTTTSSIDSGGTRGEGTTLGGGADTASSDVTVVQAEPADAHAAASEKETKEIKESKEMRPVVTPRHEAVIDLATKREERREAAEATKEQRIREAERRIREMPDSAVSMIFSPVIPSVKIMPFVEPVAKMTKNALRKLAERTIVAFRGAGTNVAGTSQLAYSKTKDGVSLITESFIGAGENVVDNYQRERSLALKKSELDSKVNQLAKRVLVGFAKDQANDVIDRAIYRKDAAILIATDRLGKYGIVVMGTAKALQESAVHSAKYAGIQIAKSINALNAVGDFVVTESDLARRIASDSVKEFARTSADRSIEVAKDAGVKLAAATFKNTKQIAGQFKDSLVIATNASEKGLKEISKISVAVSDEVTDAVLVAKESVGFYAKRTAENTNAIAWNARQYLKDHSKPIPEPRSFKTQIVRENNQTFIASLNIGVFTDMGNPYRRTPVVLFSTPKVAITNDEGMVTFHKVEVGAHVLEIHKSGQQVEKRTFILEPPTVIEEERIDVIDVTLPSIHVVVNDPLYDKVNGGRGIHWMIWVIALMLAAINVEWWWMMWRRRWRDI